LPNVKEQAVGGNRNWINECSWWQSEQDLRNSCTKFKHFKDNNKLLNRNATR